MGVDRTRRDVLTLAGEVGDDAKDCTGAIRLESRVNSTYDYFQKQQ
jgi:hypothetical protein